jgi:hypothetical protein
MQLRLTTALLLASVTAAQAQHLPQHQAPSKGTTPASQMADRARANTNPNQVLDAASGGMASLVSPDDASPAPPSGTQRLIRGEVNGTPRDPVLHYPYGRYQPTLGNVDPNSLGNSLANPLANPVTRSAPVTTLPPPAFKANAPAFSPGFGTAPAFARGR